MVLTIGYKMRNFVILKSLSIVETSMNILSDGNIKLVDYDFFLENLISYRERLNKSEIELDYYNDKLNFLIDSFLYHYGRECKI